MFHQHNVVPTLVDSARPEDRGLRLDYFLATQSLCDGSDSKVALRLVKGSAAVASVIQADRPHILRLNYTIAPKRLHDSYQLPEIMGSDHCPISVVFVPQK
jgi:exonuclease III